MQRTLIEKKVNFMDTWLIKVTLMQCCKPLKLTNELGTYVHIPFERLLSMHVLRRLRKPIYRL